jgi:hypothetical protein
VPGHLRRRGGVGKRSPWDTLKDPGPRGARTPRHSRFLQGTEHSGTGKSRLPVQSDFWSGWPISLRILVAPRIIEVPVRAGDGPLGRELEEEPRALGPGVAGSLARRSNAAIGDERRASRRRIHGRRGATSVSQRLTGAENGEASRPLENADQIRFPRAAGPPLPLGPSPSSCRRMPGTRRQGSRI